MVFTTPRLFSSSLKEWMTLSFVNVASVVVDTLIFPESTIMPSEHSFLELCLNSCTSCLNVSTL